MKIHDGDRFWSMDFGKIGASFFFSFSFLDSTKLRL